jgi:hypothetical protein
MEQPKNPLTLIENLFWEIGRLFILYFITIFSLLFRPIRVINWAIDEDKDKKVKYCPPATYLVLTLAFVIAVSKFTFYQEAFDLLEASKIFTNLFLKGTSILSIIIAFWALAVIFPINAVVVACLTGRKPTFDRIGAITKFLIYYWGTYVFLLMAMYIIFLYFKIGNPQSDIDLIFSGFLCVALAVIFGFSLKELMTRSLWQCIVVMVITQVIAPVFIGGMLAHTKNVQHWTMEQKYKAADIVGVIKVSKRVDLDKPESFGTYAIQSVLSVEWQDVWKEKYKLDNKEFPSKLVSITTLLHGQSLSIKEGEKYLAFLQLYKGGLFLIDGNPTAIYGIADDQKLIPQGHIDFFTERQIVEADSIPLGIAKSNLLNQKLK